MTGVPVISTDCRSGPAEILDYRMEGLTKALHVGKHGVLVPPNDVAAMVEALALVTEPGQREALAEAAAAGAARYGLEVAVARYWDVINHVVGIDSRASQ